MNPNDRIKKNNQRTAKPNAIGSHSATVNVSTDGIININTVVPINNKSYVYLNGYPVYFSGKREG